MEPEHFKPMDRQWESSVGMVNWGRVLTPKPHPVLPTLSAINSDYMGSDKRKWISEWGPVVRVDGTDLNDYEAKAVRTRRMPKVDAEHGH